MRISIKRTGGFAGIEQPLGSVDVSGLSDHSARTAMSNLQELIRLTSGSNSVGADRLQYDVEIQEPGQPSQKIIVFNEGDPDRADMRALSGLASALGLSVM